MGVYCQNSARDFMLITVIKLVAQKLVGTEGVKSVLSMTFGQCVALNIVITVAELAHVTINKRYEAKKIGEC